MVKICLNLTPTSALHAMEICMYKFPREHAQHAAAVIVAAAPAAAAANPHIRYKIQMNLVPNKIFLKGK